MALFVTSLKWEFQVRKFRGTWTTPRSKMAAVILNTESKQYIALFIVISFLLLSHQKVIPTTVVSVLSHTNYNIVCCYMWVQANDANGNNRHIHLTFLTYKWNIVSVRHFKWILASCNLSMPF